MTKVAVEVAGPDRFCPDCGRWLIHVHDDGTFDLAGRAAVDLTARVDFGNEEGDGLIVEAECFLRRCRARRWLRNLRG